MKKIKTLSMKDKIEQLDRLTVKEETELIGGSYGYVKPSYSPPGTIVVTTGVLF